MTAVWVAHHAHQTAHHSASSGADLRWGGVEATGVEGSMRQRGAASWQLRVYAGIDPATGRRRYRTATVRGNRADAERGLANLIAEVRANGAIGATSTLSELLEAWFAIAAVSWAPTTVRQNAFRARPLPAPAPRRTTRWGDRATDDRRVRDPAPVRQHQRHVTVARDARPSACRAALGARPGSAMGGGCGTTQPGMPTGSPLLTPSSVRRHRPSWPGLVSRWSRTRSPRRRGCPR